MGRFTVAEWLLALWPVGLLGGLASPWTFAALALGVLMPLVAERIFSSTDRPRRRRPRGAAMPEPAPPARRRDPIACTPAQPAATNTAAARTGRRAAFGAAFGAGEPYDLGGADRRPPSWRRPKSTDPDT